MVLHANRRELPSGHYGKETQRETPGYVFCGRETLEYDLFYCITHLLANKCFRLGNEERHIRCVQLGRAIESFVSVAIFELRQTRKWTRKWLRITKIVKIRPTVCREIFDPRGKGICFPARPTKKYFERQSARRVQAEKSRTSALRFHKKYRPQRTQKSE